MIPGATYGWRVGIPYRFDQPIRTVRLTLRTMTEADVDDVHAYQSREDVCRYLLFEPRTREQVAAKVAEYATATVLDPSRSVSSGCTA